MDMVGIKRGGIIILTILLSKNIPSGPVIISRVVNGLVNLGINGLLLAIIGVLLISNLILRIRLRRLRMELECVDEESLFE